MLTAKELTDLRAEHLGAVTAMLSRRRYYKGAESIAELNTTRIDGRDKSIIRTNWTKYAARQHVGFLLRERPSYISRVEGDGTETADAALKDYMDLYDRLRLHRADTRLFCEAFLYGRAYEVLGFDGGEATSTLRPAWEWIGVFDDEERLEIAVHTASLKKGSFYKGKVLAAPKKVLTVYDAESIVTYETDEKDKIVEKPVATATHLFGRIPVIAYQVTDDADPFIEQALLDTSDAFNVSRGSLADDIKFNVDSLLVTKGVDVEQLLKQDEDGVSNIEKLKSAGILPLQSEQDAEYLMRSVDIEKFREDMKVSRASIHLMACLPDLDETIGGNDGTITNITGVALRLLFTSMINQSAEFERNFEGGLRDRAEFISSLSEKRSRQPLGPFEIKFNRAIPRSDVELLQFAPNLKGILSTEDFLGQLSFVHDVQAAIRRLRAEQAANPPVESTPASPAVDAPSGDPAPPVPADQAS